PGRVPGVFYCQFTQNGRTGINLFATAQLLRISLTGNIGQADALSEFRTVKDTDFLALIFYDDYQF
ncbi:hypothetical protein, partial [uncultured Gimesia sp.]|uniref:hypothetical protein n=1 Tax=uncultured Gimesia sp. TaxID=1678688 RepID=UPI00260343F9